jgi:hypothetical protein
VCAEVAGDERHTVPAELSAGARCRGRNCFTDIATAQRLDASGAALLTRDTNLAGVVVVSAGDRARWL